MTNWFEKVSSLDAVERRRLASRLGVGRAKLVAFAAGGSGDDLKQWLMHRLPPHALPDLVVSLDALPRLPSGKVDHRRLLVSLPVAKAVPADEETVLPNAVEAELARIWAELLDIDRVGLDEDFFELGGDSLVAIRMVSMARQAGIRIEPADLADHRTIRTLALQARHEDQPRAASGVMEAPLLPIQAWHLTRGLSAPHHWNQQVRLRLRQQPCADTVSRALAELVVHHPGLGVSIVDGTQIAGGDIGNGDTRFSLDAPLFQAKLEERTLVLTAHHLIVDAVSWDIVLSDLDTLLTQLVDGQDAVSLPPAVSSLDWAAEVARYAQDPAAATDVAPWLDMAPGEVPRNPGTEGEAGTITAALGPDVSAALLGPANLTFNAAPLDLMIWALAEALSEISGRSAHRIDLESHGRQPHFSQTDLSRTVGWLTDYYPAHIVLTGADVQRGKAVKEALRRVSSRSAAFGAVRYLAGNPDLSRRLAERQRTEVLFNYLGKAARSDHKMFQVEDSPSEGMRARENARSHLFEFNVALRSSALTIDLTYGCADSMRDEAEELLTTFLHKLSWVADTCAASDRQGFTPVDFPESGMTQDELDSFLDGL